MYKYTYARNNHVVDILLVSSIQDQESHTPADYLCFIDLLVTLTLTLTLTITLTITMVLILTLSQP